jgi:hypothetical protein
LTLVVLARWLFAPVAPVPNALAPVQPGHSFFNGDKDLQNIAPVAPVAPVKNSEGGKKSATMPALLWGTTCLTVSKSWGYKRGYSWKFRNLDPM